MPAPVPILLMCRSLHGGGTERQMTEVAKALDRSRFEPHVGCFRPFGIREPELRDADVPVTEFPVRSFATWSLIRGATRFGEYVSRHDIRLVHTFDVPANLFGVLAARWFRVPVVLSSQRAYRHLTPGHFHHLLRVTDQMVDGIVVNSDLLRQELIREDRVSPGKLHLCYNAIDTVKHSPEGDSFRHLFPPGALVVGATSMLRPEKGIETLVRAFAQVRRLDPGLCLLLVGDGPCRSQLEAVARESGIAESCRFAAEQEDVAGWLRTIDIFVLPSFSEALSNSLMEAMATGCAAVASRVGGSPELVAHDRTGLLFEPADVAGLARQLETLIVNPALRRSLGEAARASVVARFSLPVAVKAIESLYVKMLESRGATVRRVGTRRPAAVATSQTPRETREPIVSSETPCAGSKVRYAVAAAGPLNDADRLAVEHLSELDCAQAVLLLTSSAPGAGEGALARVPRVRASFPELSEIALRQLIEARPDFLLLLGRVKLTGAVLEVPRFGAWSIRTDSFWPVYSAQPATRGFLIRHTQDPSKASVLETRVVLTDLWSAGGNRRRIETAMAEAPARLCRVLAATGRLPDTQRAGVPATPRQPGPLVRALLPLRASVRSFGQQTLSFSRLEDWVVGLVEAPIERFLDPSFQPEIRWLRHPKPVHFYADPFLIPAARGVGLLAEEFDYDSGRGRIVGATWQHDQWTVAHPVIQEPFHLSNPFPFEFEGALYCVPECHESNSVRLYRWWPGEGQWRFEKTLLDRFAAVDPNIVRFGGRWWMFSTARGPLVDAALYLFHAGSPFGPWVPHPANPVKVDIQSSRPGGTPFVCDGVLYRPAQDCSESYGRRLAINRVRILDPFEYAEEPARWLDPPAPFKGIHTLSGYGDYTALDVKRYRFNLRFLVKRLAHKAARIAAWKDASIDG